MNKKTLPNIVLSVIFVFCFFLPSALNAAETLNKKFLYYIYWSGIRAGQAMLEYRSTTDEIVIKTHATSAPFLSLFYKVDDTGQSTLYPDGYPKEYILKVSEGFHKRHKVTKFGKITADKQQEVVYHNILDNEVVNVVLDAPAYDPLSAFYAMTKKSIAPGQPEYIDIFDNKKLWHTEIQVLKKEKIKVLAGEFETVLIKPLIQSEGLFRKTGEILIWVTDDDRKIPVLFTSKAIIGKFYVILAEGDI